jgi:hypothetical protein
MGDGDRRIERKENKKKERKCRQRKEKQQRKTKGNTISMENLLLYPSFT